MREGGRGRPCSPKASRRTGRTGPTPTFRQPGPRPCAWRCAAGQIARRRRRCRLSSPPCILVPASPPHPSHRSILCPALSFALPRPWRPGAGVSATAFFRQRMERASDAKNGCKGWSGDLCDHFFAAPGVKRVRAAKYHARRVAALQRLTLFESEPGSAGQGARPQRARAAWKAGRVQASLEGMGRAGERVRCRRASEAHGLAWGERWPPRRAWGGDVLHRGWGSDLPWSIVSHRGDGLALAWGISLGD